MSAPASISDPLSVPGIVALASAYYGSAVLFAALELDLFTVIAAAPEGATAETIAAARRLDPRGTGLLLDAAVAVGLLAKPGQVYRNTPAGTQALVAGGPADLRAAIAYNRDVYPAWGRLTELARRGRPVEAPALHLGDDPERTRRFALAMHGRALAIGRSVVPLLELSDCHRLLDLAGGPGTYAVLMAQAFPHLVCDTLDLPAIAAIAAELVTPTEVAARVNCRVGDYRTDRFPEAAYDAVTVFGALHQEAPDTIRDILQRASSALRPGGLIYVLDLMTDPTHTQPAFSALFAVNMALTTDHGWVFSDGELHAWLAEAGFTEMRTQPVPPPMPHWLVQARKPMSPSPMSPNPEE